MLKFIGIIVVLLIVGVLLTAATRPDTFIVQRTAVIKAPPDKVFPYINDFERWTAWSPWEKKDPAMKRSYGAAKSGKGAKYAWEGNSEVGQGSMEIAESVAPQRVALRLDFVKPFEAHNNVEFVLKPEGGATRVSWRMEGPVPYLAKIVHLFMNMDKMVGGDFEAGLANLKAAAERS
jgi:uncharacterized protein YndB with AHSA1/START domain